MTLQELPGRETFFTVPAFGQSVHRVLKLGEAGDGGFINLRVLFKNVPFQCSSALIGYSTVRAYMHVTVLGRNWDQTCRASRLQAVIYMLPPLTQWMADKGILRQTALFLALCPHKLLKGLMRQRHSGILTDLLICAVCKVYGLSQNGSKLPEHDYLQRV